MIVSVKKEIRMQKRKKIECKKKNKFWILNDKTRLGKWDGEYGHSARPIMSFSTHTKH